MPTAPGKNSPSSFPARTGRAILTAAALAAATAFPTLLAGGAELPTESSARFAGSGACAACHSDLVDDSGAEVSLDRDWSPTLMANAARDPYWQATVRAETLRYPELAAVIEAKCAACHMPMAQFDAAADHESVRLLDRGFLDPDHPRHALAMDGVSCSLCHQIQPDGLGTRRTASGVFPIDRRAPAGNRVLYGPYPPDPALAGVMQTAVGAVARLGTHLGRSEFCAPCHTLRTPYVDDAGRVAGEFPEQMTFDEWRASRYRGRTTCQGCHQPAAAGAVANSGLGGAPHQPFRRHTFTGANTVVMAMLRDAPAAFDVAATPAEFAAAIDVAGRFLREQSATITIREPRLSGDTLSALVEVRNLAGHKLPTGFPSRRVWLRFTVRDGDGALVFQSGAVRETGEIAGNDNDADATRGEPHYREIRRADEVQIYEGILNDVNGAVTTDLLRAASYRKDNRLLPAGLTRARARGEIATRGDAARDPDFGDGGDSVRYRVGIGGRPGPFQVTAEALYQPIGFRWAENLRGRAASEIERFLAAFDATPIRTEVLARAETTVNRGEGGR